MCSILQQLKTTSLFGIKPACIFLYEINIQQISVPPKTSRINEYNVLFTRDKYIKFYVKNCTYDINNQQKKAMFKDDKEGIFCLGKSKFESLDRRITGRRCLVFDYTGEKISIYAYKK